MGESHVLRHAEPGAAVAEVTNRKSPTRVLLNDLLGTQVATLIRDHDFARPDRSGRDSFEQVSQDTGSVARRNHDRNVGLPAVHLVGNSRSTVPEPPDETRFEPLTAVGASAAGNPRQSRRIPRSGARRGIVQQFLLSPVRSRARRIAAPPAPPFPEAED